MRSTLGLVDLGPRLQNHIISSIVGWLPCIIKVTHKAMSTLDWVMNTSKLWLIIPLLTRLSSAHVYKCSYTSNCVPRLRLYLRVIGIYDNSTCYTHLGPFINPKERPRGCSSTNAIRMRNKVSAFLILVPRPFACLWYIIIVFSPWRHLQ